MSDACILIDISDIGKNIKKFMDKSAEKFGEKLPEKHHNFSPYLLVLTSLENTQKIVRMKKEEKFEYINSENFLNNVKNIDYVMYSPKKNICVVPCIIQNITEIINSLFGVFEKDTMFWTSINIDEKLSENIVKLIENGFDHPYMTNICPLGHAMTPSMAFAMVFDRENTDFKNTLKKAHYVLKEYKSNNTCCILNVKLSNKAVNFLKNAYMKGYSKFEKGQKEITGEMYVNKIIEEKGEFVHVIDINHESIESGNEEDVEVSCSRYNFHSHPYEAYVKHSVEKAWPSLTDYLGYLKLGEKTIFHCVATMEGLYVLSFSCFWSKSLKNIDRNFVKNNYKVDPRNKFSPQEYIRKINGILYKKNPIYNVKFFEWKDANSIFQVFYAKTGISCISGQKDLEIYRHIH